MSRNVAPFASPRRRRNCSFVHDDGISSSGGGRSLKSSTVLHAITKHHMHWGYRYGYGPAWLNMGGAYDGWTFLVCVDPGSPEFGNINAHHDSLGPEGCSSVFTEDCENSEMFLRFLETDAKRFLIGWEM